MAGVNIIKPQKGFQEKFIRSVADVTFGGAALGIGKEQSIYSNILTPNGWIKMGDVELGTELYAPFGGKSIVTNIFPQGNKEVYELETLDGRKTLCGIDHLWNIVTKGQKEKYNRDRKIRWITMKTEEVIERMDNGKPLYLPIADAQDCEDKKFPIHPYILGLLIGDGCLTRITNGTGLVKISNDEPDIIERVAKILSSTYKLHTKANYNNNIYCDSICKEIIKLGLNIYSHEKFIPEQYLWGSKEQRLDLLKGLMDSDGSVGIKNRFTYSTTAPKLKEGLTTLCRSLGYAINWCKDKRKKYKSGECWKGSIRTNEIIFSSKKHIDKFEANYEKYQKGNKNCRKNCFLRIKSITKVGVHPCQCIMVTDKNNLYVTDDYIVTHNSFAAVLSIARYVDNPNFRCVFIRKNLSEVKIAGGLYDIAKTIYGDFTDSKESDSPRITFPSGAWMDCTHVADERPKQLLERIKGWQYPFIYLDELTSYKFGTFLKLMSRNRGAKGIPTYIRGTTNPHNKHWIRKFIDWYVGVDGYIREDRDGVVRYFYISGETVDDVIWGNTKKEVYLQCKDDIDRKLRAVNKNETTFTYENFIKSFVFYAGNISENKALIDGNKDYVGSIVASGGKSGKQLLESNWNVDPNEVETIPIPSAVSNAAFSNDSQKNGDRWLTIDLADHGTDNYVALIWDGFEVIDFSTMSTSTPKLNAIRAQQIQQKYDIASSHVLYDATGNGRYLSDYIEGSIPIISNKKPRGKESLAYVFLKDELYARLVWMLNNDYISFSEGIGERIYQHKNLSDNTTIRKEFCEECSVVNWKDQINGKKRLMNKKEMNALLGMGRSMDLLDPMAFRMYPILNCDKGEELTYGIEEQYDDESYYDRFGARKKEKFDIYNENNWA